MALKVLVHGVEGLGADRLTGGNGLTKPWVRIDLTWVRVGAGTGCRGYGPSGKRLSDETFGCAVCGTPFIYEPLFQSTRD